MELNHPVSNQQPFPLHSGHSFEQPDIDQDAQHAVAEPNDSDTQSTTRHRISASSRICSGSAVDTVQVCPSNPVVRPARSQHQRVQFPSHSAPILPEYLGLTGPGFPSSSYFLEHSPGIGDPKLSFDVSDPSEVPAVSASNNPLIRNLVNTFPPSLLSASLLDDSRIPYLDYQPYTAAQTFTGSVRWQHGVEREGLPLYMTGMGTVIPLTIPVVEKEVNIEQYPRVPTPVSPTSPSSRVSIASSSEPEMLPCHEEGCSAVFHGRYGKGNLARHMRLRHRVGTRLYICEEAHCDRCFNRSDARLKHYRKHHPYLAPKSLEHRPYRVGPLDTKGLQDKE